VRTANAHAGPRRRMLRAMGKLAERYGDAARSGVYRVSDAGIPRAAAAEAGALLVEIAAARLADGWPGVEEAVGAEGSRTCVLLVPDAAALGEARHRGVLEALLAAAQVFREARRPFFAVLVDPETRLALPTLYHERARA
jgi:hypothetical protein